MELQWARWLLALYGFRRGFCVGLGLFPGAAGWVNWPARSIGLQAGLPCCMTGWGARISREPWLTTALLSLLLLGNLFRYWLFHTDWPHLWGNLLFLAAGGGFMELAAGRR